MKQTSFLNEFLSSTKIATMIVVLVFAFCLFSSVYTVKEGELGVLRTLGRVSEIEQPGLHFKFPFPIQQIDVVSIYKPHFLELGTSNSKKEKTDMTNNDTLMVTSDESIIDLNAAIEWRISDPKEYLFGAKDPELIFKNTALSSLRSIIGNYSVDYLMADGRTDVQNKVKAQLEKAIGRYDIGIQVLEVKIKDVRLPDQVQKAFEKVVDANEQKSSLIDKAKEYQNQKLAAAESEAKKILSEAEAYRDERINKANSEAAKFNSLYTQYKMGKEVTKTRLLLETLEEVLPGCNIYIVDDSGNTVKYLPIKELGGDKQ